jgi:uncharacterized protein YjbI with pentapeptide repeats
MHSRDSAKSNAAFQQDFETTLDAATERHQVADFSQFVFPAADYPDREFGAKCTFAHAIFTEKADFSNALFTDNVTFLHATFREEGAFIGVLFVREACLQGTNFTNRVDFSRAKFSGLADLTRGHFVRYADFSGAIFSQHAFFRDAVFEDEANFGRAEFMGETSFSHAEFKDAFFRLTNFGQRADFTKTTFLQCADFLGTKFCESVQFMETRFRRDSKFIWGPRFVLSQFVHPESVIFFRTYLGQALFYNCNISGVNFSSAEWAARVNGKWMLFEEIVDIRCAESLTLATSPEVRDYRLIAETYQQLKKNYDDRQDFWTAGDFHYGEMEMRRLRCERKNSLARWLHRNLGLVAWYRYASQYGESYARPLVALLIVLCVCFAFSVDRSEFRGWPAPFLACKHKRNSASSD